MEEFVMISFPQSFETLACGLGRQAVADNFFSSLEMGGRFDIACVPEMNS
jgi:hypothetical protein